MSGEGLAANVSPNLHVCAHCRCDAIACDCEVAAIITDTRQWKWWAEEMDQIAMGPRAGEWLEPETYTIAAATREAVIASAVREFGAGARIAIVEATQDGPFETDLFEEDGPVMDALLDQFAERNGHRFGEDGFEGDIDTLALAAAMNRAFAAFLPPYENYIITRTFTEQRNKEIIEPAMCAVGGGNAG